MADSFVGIYNAFEGFGRMMDNAIDEAFDEDSPPAAPISANLCPPPSPPS